MSKDADCQGVPGSEDEGTEAVFTREDLIVVMTTASWNMFRDNMESYRTVLRSSTLRDSLRDDRPPELRRLSKLLDRDKRRAVEAASDEARKSLGKDMNRLFDVDESGDEAEGKAGTRHPFALEQLVALAMAGIGKDRLGQAVARLVVAVGDDPTAGRYAMEYCRWSNREPTSSVLGRALLPVIVASFEELLGGLVRLWLTLFPEALNADKKSIDSGIAWRFQAPDDIRRWAVDTTMRRFIASGLSEWNKTLGEKLNIRLDVLTEYWPELVEAFARRNAVVHAGGIADVGYLGQLIADTERPDPGTRLICDKQYMDGVLDTVGNLGTVLVVAWLTHFLPQAHHAAKFAQPEVLRALEERRWYDARTMATAVLTPLGVDHKHHDLRINLWMAQRELGDNWPQVRDDIERWKPPEADPEYALAKAALLRDERGILDAFRLLRATGRAPALVSEWPLMRDMKEQSKAVAAALRSGTDAGLKKSRPRKGRQRRR